MDFSGTGPGATSVDHSTTGSAFQSSHTPSGASASATTTFSTPIRIRSEKTNYTCGSDNDELKDDVNKYTHTGIDPAKFLRLAFGLSPADYDALETKVKSMKFRDSDAYQQNLQLFKDAVSYKEDKSAKDTSPAETGNDSATRTSAASGTAAPRGERGMYEPLVNMGNMILEEAEGEDSANVKEVRLWYMNEKHLAGCKGKRKPDLVLIPKEARDRVEKMQDEERSVAKKVGLKQNEEDEDEDEDEKDASGPGRVDVREVLTVFELKKDRNSVRRSHGSGSGRGSRNQSEATSQSAQSSRAAGSKASVRSSATAKSTGKKRKSTAESVSNKRSKGEKSAADGRHEMLSRTSVVQAHSTLSTTAEEKEDREKLDDTTGRMQLARYALAMLSARGDRKYSLGVRLNAHQMTFAFYHRSALIEADHFDLCKNPDYFAMFLLMFQSDPRLYGLNGTTGYCDPFDIDNPSTMTMDTTVLKDHPLLAGGLELGELLSSEYCLVGRGSAVFKAKSPSFNFELAVKFCWQEESRKPEWEYLAEAAKVIGGNVAEVYGHANLDDDTPLESLIKACSQKGSYQRKKYRILVMKYYENLSELENLQALPDLMKQCVECASILTDFL